jgi:hypothetical protein
MFFELKNLAPQNWTILIKSQQWKFRLNAAVIAKEELERWIKYKKLFNDLTIL